MKKLQIGYFIISTNKHTKDKFTILTAVFSLNQIDMYFGREFYFGEIQSCSEIFNYYQQKHIRKVLVIATVVSFGSNLLSLSNCSDRKSGNHIRGYPIRVRDERTRIFFSFLFCSRSRCSR